MGGSIKWKDVLGFRHSYIKKMHVYLSRGRMCVYLSRGRMR